MSSLLASRPAERPATPARPAIEGGRNAVVVDGVTKRFGQVTALHEASLRIEPGELMTLLGPSGCGKTTLLNLIAGFLSPDGGSIRIDDRIVTDVPTFQREIGFLFQNYALFPHMNVAANVGYGLRMRGTPRAEADRRVAEALALVKLVGLEHRRPRELSGGQQQRVALARALVIRPKVLLLDEPFSALDKSLRASMQVEVRDIQKRVGVTTVFVTHDQSEALSLSDRIAVLSEGRIRQIGTPDAIYRRPIDPFVASFVGDVNVLRARLEGIDGNTARVALGAVRVPVPASGLAGVAAGSAVELYLRPEQLRVAVPGELACCSGRVATHVYQGGHVDLYIDVTDAPSGRVLIRSPGPDAILRWPVGTAVQIALASEEAVAFPSRAP